MHSSDSYIQKGIFDVNLKISEDFSRSLPLNQVYTPMTVLINSGRKISFTQKSGNLGQKVTN